MNWKIKKAYKRLRYRFTDARRYGHLSVDRFDVEGCMFRVVGWLYDREHAATRRYLVIRDSSRSVVFRAALMDIERTDVASHLQIKKAVSSGFDRTLFVKTSCDLSVAVEYEVGDCVISGFLGVINSNSEVGGSLVVRDVSISDALGDVDDFEKIELARPLDDSPHDDLTVIDVIVPVYNGMKYLPALFEGIEKTDLKYRLIVVDDASSDREVNIYLDEFVEDHPEAILLRNQKNLGFVASVNRGLAISENDVVLVNTDVELPPFWLERMAASLAEDGVASATPFTNSGTICSFPVFCQDNRLVDGFSVEEVDSYFKEIVPSYRDMPTGVGFCMGMSRKAIDAVGVFDEESFGKGYGEENDWCRRASDAGFRNVMVNNLFVFHNHGGSFTSKEKAKLMQENAQKLLKKHPNYDALVADYVRQDPFRAERAYVLARLIEQRGDLPTIVSFSHALGGGADSYLKSRIKECQEANQRFISIQYDSLTGRYRVLLYCGMYESGYYVKDIGGALVRIGNVSEVWVNELVSYPNVATVLVCAIELSSEKHAKLKFFLHDYYALCQSYNLMNEEGSYCELPDFAECRKCFLSIRHSDMSNLGIFEYRSLWRGFLKKCDEVVVFSRSSRDLLGKVYCDLSNVSLIPHKVDPLPEIRKRARLGSELVIGIPGAISHIKGLDVVRSLASYIEEKGLDARIAIIGYADGIEFYKMLSETGRYEKDKLPLLALSEGVDVFFIPSICPETFSYTTSEILSMGYPVAVFDLGAPAERVRRHGKGLVIPKGADTSDIFAALKDLAVRDAGLGSLPVRAIPLLFVVSEGEEESPSVISACQELLEHGYVPKVVSAANLRDIDMTSFSMSILFDGVEESAVEAVRFAKDAEKIGKKIFREIKEVLCCDEDL